MLIRSLLQPNTRKICCYTLYPQIRYGSNYAKNTSNNASQLSKTIVDKLGKKFPRLTAIYTVVYGGMRGIASDFRTYFGVITKISQSKTGLKVLSLEELEFYHSFKLSARKLIPISLLAVLPFGNMFIIPLVYFLPRKTVTHHFWTENQKATFPIEELKARLQSHRQILQYFKDCPSGKMSDEVLVDWNKLLDKLNQGGRPEVSDVLKVSSLFTHKGPFYLQRLSKFHTIHLGNTYGLTSLFSPLSKVVRFAEYNAVVDQKIVQNGGPKALPAELRSKICYFRGVDSMNMSQAEQIAFLQKWIQINAKVDISNYSLMLHTPILLGYNDFHRKSDVLEKSRKS